ncbi:MAG TPA: nickel pincer cofactor biosynthesis protein LarB [Candidatus Polarisedimenticolaceae bacterium]|nr:nickel pincer cofactor biosynthesis protein LarB [Candidatus Polarisedimenticolaceae bacterium]
MDRDAIRTLLAGVRARRISVAEAEERLRHFPSTDLGFATIDTHRALRRGLPETVYGQGKSPEQIASIVDRLASAGQTAMVTRAHPDAYAAVRERHPAARYHPEARTIVLGARAKSKARPGVAVLTAGTTDIGVAEEAAITAEAMGERVRRIYDVGVAGLHRLLAHQRVMASSNVLVVVAGMEGALPSVVAGLVDAPVIAVPTSVGYGAGAGGFAALLSMLNACAPGVAVVNIDNGHGAGCLASLINRLAHNRTGRSKKPR